jgi:hypothetical protein
MRIEVYNAYSEETQIFEGDDEEVRKQINASFSYLARYGHTSLEEDIKKLGNTQAFFVKVEK